ncbi:MAG: hypothetical protein JW888_14330 [Pirellulales bacterium]|nr:hypothetical protein [Pirellulales bacterium]
MTEVLDRTGSRRTTALMTGIIGSFWLPRPVIGARPNSGSVKAAAFAYASQI